METPIEAQQVAELEVTSLNTNEVITRSNKIRRASVRFRNI
jgi:hypothetical protein